MQTLREILKSRRISQRKLHRLTGISFTSINRAVAGSPIQKTTLKLICQELDIEPGEVAGITLYNGAEQAKTRKRA